MKLVSQQDPSINFIDQQLEGFLESRYVRKCPEYFICYLSSQTNCNRGCKFCFLTTTKQTKVEDVRPGEYLSQAQRVIKHYSRETKANYVYWNFMARGEAFANPYFLMDADKIFYSLSSLAHEYDPDLGSKFNVSTIIPRDFNQELRLVFKTIHPTIYYSLYSMEEEFRQKWMPNAKDPRLALDLLVRYQEYSKKKIKIHQCFIEGENDGQDTVAEWCNYLNALGLDWDFNLVRYNPYSVAQGQESSENVIALNLQLIEDACPGTVKVIPRVGMDVHASCGTFYEAKNET